MYATIDEFRSQLGATAPAYSPEYAAKMMHDVPESESVDRSVFILQRVAGKRVLEFGASGQMHDGIVKAAKSVIGVDREDSPGVIGFDLDAVGADCEPHVLLPPWTYEEPTTFDVIVCGEILEHLSNPGFFLSRLRKQWPQASVVITVPNAFAKSGRSHIERGIENVNRDHVAWYSYKTLRTLLERYGYTIKEFYWYNGPPYVAEGLIVVTE